MELFDELNGILTDHYEPTFGSQMNRLGTMSGLFGQLSNAYTSKKLRKREKFEQFVRKQILVVIFDPEELPEEENT